MASQVKREVQGSSVVLRHPPIGPLRLSLDDLGSWLRYYLRETEDLHYQIIVNVLPPIRAKGFSYIIYGCRVEIEAEEHSYQRLSVELKAWNTAEDKRVRSEASRDASRHIETLAKALTHTFFDHPAKPGPKPKSDAEWGAAVAAWEEVKKRGDLTFEVFSELWWGTHADGGLKVPKSTFYDHRKKFLS